LEKKKKVDTKSEMISPSDSMVPNISSDALAKDREKVIVFNCDQMVAIIYFIFLFYLFFHFFIFHFSFFFIKKIK